MQPFNSIDEVIHTSTIGTIRPIVAIPDAINFLIQPNCTTNHSNCAIKTRIHLASDVSLYVMQERCVSHSLLWNDEYFPEVAHDRMHPRF